MHRAANLEDGVLGDGTGHCLAVFQPMHHNCAGKHDQGFIHNAVAVPFLNGMRRDGTAVDFRLLKNIIIHGRAVGFYNRNGVRTG